MIQLINLQKSKINSGLLVKWLVFLPLMLLVGLVAGALNGIIKVLRQAEKDIWEE